MNVNQKIRTLPFYSDLTQDERVRIENCARIREYKRNSLIY